MSYRNDRIAEIDGQLRLHRLYGMHLPQLPEDLTSVEYRKIAERAYEREQASLKALGIRRVAPDEGPRP